MASGLLTIIFLLKNELDEMRKKLPRKKYRQIKMLLGKPINFLFIQSCKQPLLYLGDLTTQSNNGVFIKQIKEQLEFDAKLNPHRKNIFSAIKALYD